MKRVLLGWKNEEKVIANGHVVIRFSKIPDFKYGQEHYIIKLHEILYQNHPCKIIDDGNFNTWDQLYYDDDFLIHASIDTHHHTTISLNLYVNQTFITCTAHGTTIEPTEYAILLQLPAPDLYLNGRRGEAWHAGR